MVCFVCLRCGGYRPRIILISWGYREWTKHECFVFERVFSDKVILKDPTRGLYIIWNRVSMREPSEKGTGLIGGFHIKSTCVLVAFSSTAPFLPVVALPCSPPWRSSLQLQQRCDPTPGWHTDGGLFGR